MTKLGRILGRRGQRAGDDHDPSASENSTAVHPTGDSGERTSGLWESGAHRERPAGDSGGSAVEAGSGAAAGGGGMAGEIGDGAGERNGGWRSGAEAGAEEPAHGAPHPDPAGEQATGTGAAVAGGEQLQTNAEPPAGDLGARSIGAAAPTVASEPADVSRPGADPVPAAAAADTEAPRAGFSIRPRSRMRRRLRYLRRARELRLRDLGGFVYERTRTTGGDTARQEQLLLDKIGRLRAIDEEIGHLSATLGTPARRLVIREPGVGGTCPTCGELHPSDARFCANCGTRVDVRGASGGAEGSVLAAWTNPEAQPTPGPAPASGVTWGEAPVAAGRADSDPAGVAQPVDPTPDHAPRAVLAEPVEPAAEVVEPDEAPSDAPRAVLAEPVEPAAEVVEPDEAPSDAPRAVLAEPVEPAAEVVDSDEAGHDPAHRVAPAAGAGQPAHPEPEVAHSLESGRDSAPREDHPAAAVDDVPSEAADRGPDAADASTGPGADSADDETPTAVQPVATNHQEPR